MIGERACKSCQAIKPESEFPKSGRICRGCKRAESKAYYHNNKSYFQAYRAENREACNASARSCIKRNRHERYGQLQALKARPCQDCCQSFPWYVMDFDHRDPSEKEGAISDLVKALVPWPRVLEEIEKCDLVCVCCHRLRTYSGDGMITNDLKRSPCVDCSGVFQPCQMDFDHVRGDKVANVGRLVARHASYQKILEEVAKCELVCANCHRIRTQIRMAGSKRASVDMTRKRMAYQRSK